MIRHRMRAKTTALRLCEQAIQQLTQCSIVIGCEHCSVLRTARPPKSMVALSTMPAPSPGAKRNECETIRRHTQGSLTPRTPNGSGSQSRSKPKILRPMSTFKASTGWIGSDAGFIAVIASTHVCDVRSNCLRAGTARLPDLPVGSHCRPNPGHSRTAATGKLRYSSTRQRRRRGSFQHCDLRNRRGHLLVRSRPDHEYREPRRLASGRTSLALRCRRVVAAAALPQDHPARRQGRHRRNHLGRLLAPPVLP